MPPAHDPDPSSAHRTPSGAPNRTTADRTADGTDGGTDGGTEPGDAGRVDHGFTHVALSVTDLDASLGFYRRYADMTPVHRRTSDDGTRVAWITDHTRPFVVVLIEHEVTHTLGGWSHLGIGVDSRDEVDRRLALAAAEGLEVWGPTDAGPPTGYYGVIVDPDGHNLEIAHGQEVAFTVTGADGTDGAAASS